MISANQKASVCSCSQGYLISQFECEDECEYECGDGGECGCEDECEDECGDGGDDGCGEDECEDECECPGVSVRMSVRMRMGAEMVNPMSRVHLDVQGSG